MGLNWSDAVVLVTGASRGIGAAVARAAARRGARLGLLARSAADLDALAGGLAVQTVAVPVDVGRPDELVAAIRQVQDTLGPIDVLVNNAGIGAYGPFTEKGAEHLATLWPVNVTAVATGMAEVLPAMVERRQGTVVNVASIAGRIGAPGEAAYSATKFAVVGLTEAVRAEVAASGVRVCLVDPGPVDTDFFSARGHPYMRNRPRPVSAERVAKAVLRAVDRGKAEAFVPGWLRPALVVKTLAPPLYAAGVKPVARQLAAEFERR